MSDEQVDKKSNRGLERFLMFLFFAAILAMGACLVMSEEPPRPEFHGSNM